MIRLFGSQLRRSAVGHALPSLACLLATSAVVAGLLAWSGLPREQSFTIGIFVLAAGLWMTQAIPLFATSLVIVAAVIVLLSNPGDWPGLGFEAGGEPAWQRVIELAASPVILLFFGGFILARAAVKERVDTNAAALIVRPFGGRPRATLAGVMLATACFSMWMSNTAATAMMIALAAAMFATGSPSRAETSGPDVPPATPPGFDPMHKATILGIAFAANIGGMATPIGTPPNAIALQILRERGLEVGFLQWMLIAVPLVAVLIAFTWLVLVAMYRPSDPASRLAPQPARLSPRSWWVVAVFLTTVGLWLTTDLHGLPAAVVALLPPVLFFATGILNRHDLASVEWDVLLLITGGLALGFAVGAVGLDQTIQDAMARSGLTTRFGVVAILLLTTMGLSTFVSNTATANLVLPVGIAVIIAINPAATAAERETYVVTLAVSLALVASISMALPVSTPPNAIAFGQNVVTTRELVVPGVTIGLVGLLLVLLFGGAVIGFWYGPQ